MKVVINKCYGGFGLSHEGILYYAAVKGLAIYPEENKIYPDMLTYFLVPKNERPEEPINWVALTQEARVSYNNEYYKKIFSIRDISRTDKFLIKTVQDIGGLASGQFADLQIIEIPDGVDYEIVEHDGIESIHEKHRSWS